nr:immunoglobulin heavy chain junction region [Mus musculus]
CAIWGIYVSWVAYW